MADFETLNHVSTDPGKSSLQILSAQDCFFDASVSLAENLAIRFSEHSSYELEQLVIDYQAENQILQDLIEKAGLMEYRAEILRLIQKGEQIDLGDPDVTMA